MEGRRRKQFWGNTGNQLILPSNGIILGLIFAGIIKKMPLKLTRLIAGILLATTGIPLLLYGFDVPTSELLHWLIPPLH